MILAGDSPKRVPGVAGPETCIVRVSEIQARLRDVRTTEGSTTQARARGNLGLIAPILEQVDW
jgi:hypothetical protein